MVLPAALAHVTPADGSNAVGDRLQNVLSDALTHGGETPAKRPEQVLAQECPGCARTLGNGTNAQSESTENSIQSRPGVHTAAAVPPRCAARLQ